MSDDKNAPEPGSPVSSGKRPLGVKPLVRRVAKKSAEPNASASAETPAAASETASESTENPALETPAVVAAPAARVEAAPASGPAAAVSPKTPDVPAGDTAQVAPSKTSGVGSIVGKVLAGPKNMAIAAAAAFGGFVLIGVIGMKAW